MIIHGQTMVDYGVTVVGVGVLIEKDMQLFELYYSVRV